MKLSFSPVFLVVELVEDEEVALAAVHGSLEMPEFVHRHTRS